MKMQVKGKERGRVRSDFHIACLGIGDGEVD
jgi:hypothetical protein